MAYEIAEPHPDMNIKVAAFTVSEKSSNTVYNNDTRWDCLTFIIGALLVSSFSVKVKAIYTKRGGHLFWCLQCTLYAHVYVADSIGLPYFSGLKSHVLISHDYLSQSK